MAGLLKFRFLQYLFCVKIIVHTYFLFIFLLHPACVCTEAERFSVPVDKWGGIGEIRNPDSKYETGLAKSITEWTITDTSKSWSPDELSGSILQPNIDTNVYFLIKSNTSTSITVFGSDDNTSQERAYRHISDENDGTNKYAILDRWSCKKIRGRWLLFNPFGNAFFIKSLNGYDYELYRYGRDHKGNSFEKNMLEKYSTNDIHEALQHEIDIVKKMGFNCWGEILDTGRVAPGGPYNAEGKCPERYLPFITQIRVHSLNLDAMGVDYFIILDDIIWDAFDASFQDALENYLLIESGAATAGITDFNNRTGWSFHYLTPYREARYNISANPYYIGLDWDEEPAYLRSEALNEHLGYHIIVSAGTTARKTRAINYLRNKYNTISKLNISWGGGLSEWDDLLNDTGAIINGLLSSEPCCRDFGLYNELNTSMKSDLDAIAEDFWRVYCKKVHDTIDNITEVHMINFGPGYHGWCGRYDSDFDGTTSPEYFFRGSVSENSLEPYIDVIGIGDPLHGPHENINDLLEYMRDDLTERYEFHGRPYWHESCWITAEADSGLTYSGKIDFVESSVLYDYSCDFRTDNNWVSAFSSTAGMWILPDINKDKSRHIYYRVNNASSFNGSLETDYATGPGIHWAWDSSPDMRGDTSAGNFYALISHDCIAHLGQNSEQPYVLYIPLTQKIRSAMYVQFLDDIINFQSDNGDYIDVGFSHWEFYDYGFREGTHEMRNWGFETVQCHLYNGIEAIVSNGEMQNCGNFIGPVSYKLNNIYNEILLSHD